MLLDSSSDSNPIKSATMASASGDNFADLKISVVISLLAWPITYFVDQAVVKVDENVSRIVECNYLVVL